MKNFRWDKHYLYWGITAFAVIACSVLFYMLLQYWPGVKMAISNILRILSPITWGLVIAYLLGPLMSLAERRLTTPLAERLIKTNGHKRRALARSLAILLSVIVAIVLIGALLWQILPQVYRSIESIVISLPGYISRGIVWVEAELANFPDLEEFVVSTMGSISSYLTSWVYGTVMPQIDKIITNVSTGVYSVLKTLLNILIGLVASIYILYNKEIFAAQIKKILYSIFSVERVESILKAVDFTDKAFTGFIFGKALDSLIIGMICYIGCVAFRIADATLVSVIVGVTNIIPFFGPFIGAVPSSLIILMDSPVQCLIFIIFVICLQQFDGNILGPKILGNTTGVGGFWVLFSILVGAGLFGFIGMLCGVPVFAVIYAAIKGIVERRLKKNGLPSETAQFIGMNHIDPSSGGLVPLDPEKRRRKKSDKNGSAPSASADGGEKDAPAQSKEAGQDE